jgi:ferrochelatase
VLFSYHGVPERHVTKSDPTGAHCLASDTCCDAIVHANRYCYRAHCYETTRRLAAALEIPDDQRSVGFQSRLGRTPWIRPYTDDLLDELAAAKKKRLAVFSPAFVADCLETLEEIGMRAKEQFVAAGGEDLALIPSLNAHPRWVEAVCDMIRERS